MMFNDAENVSALNSADQSPTHPQPQPHPFAQQQQQQRSNSFHQHNNNNINNGYNSSSCIILDSPPQNPILKQQQQHQRNKDNAAATAQQQQQQCQEGGAKTSSFLAGETCPFCVVDSSRLTLDIRALQQQVSLLTNRVDYSDQRLSKDREKVESCISQLDEYSVNLSVVMKWTKAIGACLPELVKGMIASSSLSPPSNYCRTTQNDRQRQQQSQRGANSGVRSSSAKPTTTTPQQQQLQQQQRTMTTVPTATGKPPIAGSGSISNDVSAILQDEEDDEGQQRHQRQQNRHHHHHNQQFIFDNDRHHDDDDEFANDDDDDEQNQNQQTAVISVAEVRTMFRTFRDELIRLRERSEMLEQRVNDAVCKIEGANTHKLKEEVEGRLRTMMHSLHETMIGSSSPLGELAQQVSSLRTEVEVVRSKTEAANSHRTLLETRLNDATAKLRDIQERDSARTNRSDQVTIAYGEEVREIRNAMKELSSTVNHRLESERSAREFDAGDIRSQLKVLLRSPSPMARIGGNGLILSTSPQRSDF